MAVSNINAIINKDIHKVWDIVFAVDTTKNNRSITNELSSGLSWALILKFL